MPAHTPDAPSQPHDNPDLIPLAAVTKAAPRHPLDPLTAGEIEAAREILVAAGLLGDTVRVPMLLPDEPTKGELAAWSPGEPFDRRVDVTLMDAATGTVTEAIVSVSRGVVVATRELDPSQAPYGQPQYLFEEYDRAAEIVKASPEWRAAMTRRGLEDRIDLAFCSPLAPGFVGRENEVGRRVIRSLTFLRDSEDDIPWAHPVEGLIVHVDLVSNAVIGIEDQGDVPVPVGSGKYTPDAVTCAFYPRGNRLSHSYICSSIESCPRPLSQLTARATGGSSDLARSSSRRCRMRWIWLWRRRR